jgi:carbon storage regulator CsrA
MLVLTRKAKQRIMLSNGVTIVVSHIKGKSVKLAVSAPAGVRILREELLSNQQRHAKSEQVQ